MSDKIDELFKEHSVWLYIIMGILHYSIVIIFNIYGKPIIFNIFKDIEPYLLRDISKSLIQISSVLLGFINFSFFYYIGKNTELWDKIIHHNVDSFILISEMSKITSKSITYLSGHKNLDEYKDRINNLIEEMDESNKMFLSMEKDLKDITKNVNFKQKIWNIVYILNLSGIFILLFTSILLGLITISNNSNKLLSESLSLFITGIIVIIFQNIINTIQVDDIKAKSFQFYKLYNETKYLYTKVNARARELYNNGIN